jgi:monofunctional glycosyltransferase
VKRIFQFFILFLILFIGYVFYKIPSQDKIKGCFTTSMFELDFCPQSKNYVPIKSISTYMQKAVITTEDGRFFEHDGFDSDGIEKCIEKIKEKKQFVCGGSTITQQLAKNLFLSKNKNFMRKGLEALITIKLEKTLTKKEILEKYLNVVQFGKNIYGIKQASQIYFKKSPSQLDVVESAFLAMVLPSPEKYSQSYYRKDLTRFARRRIKQIIENMHQFKEINDEAYYVGIERIDSFLSRAKPPAPVTDNSTSAIGTEINEADKASDMSDADLDEELSPEELEEMLDN